MSLYCCPTVVGGAANISIAGIDRISGGPFRHKFTTEGSVTIRPLNYTIQDRSGLFHKREPSNSYIEGTILLTRGLSSITGVNLNDQLFDDDFSAIGMIHQVCSATISVEMTCGDVYTMQAGAFSGDNPADITEGTQPFRFSSPYIITEYSRAGLGN